MPRGRPPKVRDNEPAQQPSASPPELKAKPIPIRLLRQRADMCGVRLVPLMTRSEITQKMLSLGADPETAIRQEWDILETSDVSLLKAKIYGQTVQISADGTFHVGLTAIRNCELEDFISMLQEFRDWADDRFDETYEAEQENRVQTIERLQRESEAHTHPVSPDPTIVASEHEWDRLGFRGAFSWGAKLQKVAEAYGIPLGEELDPENSVPDPDFGSPINKWRHFSQEELIEKILKALETPV
jgi:hypothetical protein